MPLDFSQAPTTQATRTSLTFEEVAAALHARTLEVCRYLLPGGRIESGEYCVGDLNGARGKSLKINLAKGAWADWAGSDRGGDLVSLWAAVNGIEQHEARDQAAEWIGLTRFTPAHSIVSKPETIPVARTPRPGDIVYKYETPDGQPYLDVVRGLDKSFSQWTPQPDGLYIRGAPLAPRHLYNLPAVLAASPATPIIVCEGEKKVHALAEVGYVATTCVGGSSGVKMSDWGPLRGKNVIAWRDNDEPGKKWLAAVEAVLREVGARSFRVVA